MKDGRIGLLDYGMVGNIDSINRINLFQLMYGRIFLGESLNRAFLPAILMMVGNILIGFG